MDLTEISAEPSRRIQLDVTGMTCRMCSSRIAKQLNKVDGVRASVDLATRTATIDASRDIDAAELCEMVRKAGYGATERVVDTVEVVAPGAGGAHGPCRQLIGLLGALLGWLGICRR